MEAGLDWLSVQDGGGVSSRFEPIQTYVSSLKIHFESVGGDGDTPPLTKGKRFLCVYNSFNGEHWSRAVPLLQFPNWKGGND